MELSDIWAPMRIMRSVLAIEFNIFWLYWTYDVN